MRILIIGFGHAGKAYSSACLSTLRNCNVGVVDTDPTVQSKVTRGVDFYTEVPDGSFDLVIVATPPSTHYTVLKAIRNQASRIILEKPFALSRIEIEKILGPELIGNIFFSIHALYGEEIMLAREIIESGELGSSLSVTQLFFDPYWPHGPTNLGGPFWDSIYNGLGILNVLFNDIELQAVQHKLDQPNYFEICCLGRTGYGTLTYRFTVDWSKEINLKVTEISSDQRQSGILVNHSQQCLTRLNGLGLNYKRFTAPRLTSHYREVVVECLDTMDLTLNHKMARKISNQVIKIADNLGRF